MSARTEITSSRFRRQRIGSSATGSIRATCASGTATPSRLATVRSARPATSSRSPGTARATTCTRSVPSRISVTGRPETSVCSVSAMSCGASPSARARSWSTTSRIAGAISFHCRCGSRTSGFAAIASRTSPAIRRTSCGSSPITRNCTGCPTGGPKLKRSTRTRAWLSAPSATACSSRALIRSRASVSFDRITISAKDGFGSCGFSPSQKRTLPCPT